jgi:hypothetical protein
METAYTVSIRDFSAAEKAADARRSEATHRSVLVRT